MMKTLKEEALKVRNRARTLNTPSDFNRSQRAKSIYKEAGGLHKAYFFADHAHLHTQVGIYGDTTKTSRHASANLKRSEWGGSVFSCTCPDFTDNGALCKHIRALAALIITFDGELMVEPQENRASRAHAPENALDPKRSYRAGRRRPSASTQTPAQTVQVSQERNIKTPAYETQEPEAETYDGVDSLWIDFDEVEKYL